jgi:hypothetical protein
MPVQGLLDGTKTKKPRLALPLAQGSVVPTTEEIRQVRATDDP